MELGNRNHYENENENEHQHGYRTCDGISFGKDYDQEMKKLAIPSVYFCERDPKRYGYVCKNVTSVSDRLGVSGFSTNLSRPIREDVISDDIYDSFLKHLLVGEQHPDGNVRFYNKGDGDSSSSLKIRKNTRRKDRMNIQNGYGSWSGSDKPKTRKHKRPYKRKKNN